MPNLKLENLQYMLMYCAGIAVGQEYGDQMDYDEWIGLGAMAALILYWNKVPSQIRWFALGLLSEVADDGIQTIVDQVKNLIPSPPPAISSSGAKATGFEVQYA